jgi:hypothetical protein
VKAVETYPRGIREHDIDGAIVDPALDDTGDPVSAHRLFRRQVKRPCRAKGSYHFNAAFGLRPAV